MTAISTFGRHQHSRWAVGRALGLACLLASACTPSSPPQIPAATEPAAVPAATESSPVQGSEPVAGESVAEPAAESLAEPAPLGPRIVLRMGEQPDGPTDGFVARLGLAVTNGRGELGFTGTIQHRDKIEPFVWAGGRIVWRGGSTPDTNIAAPSPLLGLGNDGQFLFRTLINDKDGLWSHRGLLLDKGSWAEGLDEGAVITFSRRPTMTADGTGYWISEFQDGAGTGRALFKSPGTDPEATTVVLRSDDLVEGEPIARPRGLDLAYQVSDNGEHLIQVLQLGEATSLNDVVYVDGSVVVRRGESTGSDDNWGRFTSVSINDRGDYLIGGETDGESSNRVLAYNGTVGLREGDTVDGRVLESDASLLSASINNSGQAVHLWSTAGFGALHLFFACDASRLDQSVHLVSSGAELPLGDAYPPTQIRNFNFVGHGPALSLGPGPEAFVEAMLTARTDAGAVELDAVIGLPLPDCGEVVPVR